MISASQYLSREFYKVTKNTIQTPLSCVILTPSIGIRAPVLLLIDIKHLTVSDKDPKVVWENTPGDITHLLQFKSHILSWWRLSTKIVVRRIILS